MTNNYLTRLILICFLQACFFCCFTQNPSSKYPLDFNIAYSDEAWEKADCIFSNEDRNILESRAFFNYTTPTFREQSGKQNLIEADASVVREDRKIFLELQIRIHSINARRSFGKIKAGERMKVYLINGQYFYTENSEKDKGRVSRDEGISYYRIKLALEKDDIKSLKKHFVDKIGIMWEKGYQEYEIHNIDLIKNQLNCIKA